MVRLNKSVGNEPIFQQEKQDDVLILVVVEDPTVTSYASKQHEYNTIYRMLGECSPTNLLFDLHRCQILDSITIGIIVSLTTCCRTGGGAVAMSGLSEDVNGMLARLMLLQPDSKRAMWRTHENREIAIAELKGEQAR